MNRAYIDVDQKGRNPRPSAIGQHINDTEQFSKRLGVSGNEPIPDPSIVRFAASAALVRIARALEAMVTLVGQDLERIARKEARSQEGRDKETASAFRAQMAKLTDKIGSIPDSMPPAYPPDAQPQPTQDPNAPQVVTIDLDTPQGRAFLSGLMKAFKP